MKYFSKRGLRHWTWTKKIKHVVQAQKKQNIIQIGDPVLRQCARQVEPNELRTEEFSKMINKMILAMRKSNGFGIAAPQLGYSMQVFAMEFSSDNLRRLYDFYGADVAEKMEMTVFPLRVIINPKIEILDKTLATHHESCLSMSKYAALVPRARSLKLNAMNIDGEDIEFVANGYKARIIQHEVDHLMGNLYVDSMLYKSLQNVEWRDYID